MNAELTGYASGQTRAELVSRAKDAATQYFGEKCVAVTLSDEHCNSESIEGLGSASIRQSVNFTANWTAAVAHTWDTPSYGFPKCRGCEKTGSSR